MSEMQIHLTIDGKELARIITEQLARLPEQQKEQREAEERAALMRKIAYDRILHEEGHHE
jgi:hypothetical protein